jgi:drug/metabolite transporter (DMT)-like permease
LSHGDLAEYGSHPGLWGDLRFLGLLLPCHPRYGRRHAALLFRGSSLSPGGRSAVPVQLLARARAGELSRVAAFSGGRLLLFAGSYGALFWAETRIASGTAAVIAAMIPIWILLGEVLVFRTERLGVSVAGATLLGILGVLLVTRSIGFEHSMVSGVLVELAGTVVFSFATLWSRSLTLPDDQAMRAGLQMGLGSLGLLVISAVAGELPRIPAALAAWQWHTLVSFLYLVTCASILAFTSYTWLIHHEPATRVASYAYVNPLIALITGVTLGGEHVSALQAAGAAMIILGVVQTMLTKSKAPAAKPPSSDRVAAH